MFKVNKKNTRATPLSCSSVSIINLQVNAGWVLSYQYIFFYINLFLNKEIHQSQSSIVNTTGNESNNSIKDVTNEHGIYRSKMLLNKMLHSIFFGIWTENQNLQTNACIPVNLCIPSEYGKIRNRKSYLLPYGLQSY